MRILLISICWFSIQIVAHADTVNSVNGFKLWQFKDAVKNSLGAPFKTIDTEYSILEAHKLHPKGYMVFEYLNNMPHNIFSIQITGVVSPMPPVKGLVLGDKRDDVIKKLGNPSNVKKLNDPVVEVLSFDNLNASLEIDKNNLLYSIRVNLTKDMMNETESSTDVWQEFKSAIKNKDTDKFIELLRPDVEIFKSGKTLTINKRFSDFKSNPDKDFLDALIGAKNSLLVELNTTEATSEVRIAENVGVGFVYKFYKGNIVKEVVFFPYDGKYRVYEIAFVDKK